MPESAYHVYNRANGSERLFRSAENYRYFLQKYQAYILPIADTFCYCLMPNHFHFLIRIKSEKYLADFFNTGMASRRSATLQGFKTLEGFARHEALSRLLSQQFSHLFNSYTQAFNRQQNRKGSLFMHPFKRKKISSDAYLRRLVQYIHHNPIKAGFCKTAQDWNYSSYPLLLSTGLTFLQRDELISWFGDINNFINVHSEAANQRASTHL